jgi:hypothetical protein
MVWGLLVLVTMKRLYIFSEQLTLGRITGRPVYPANFLKKMGYGVTGASLMRSIG